MLSKELNLNEYTAPLEENTFARIGGTSKSEFLPNLNFHKFDNEVFLNINPGIKYGDVVDPNNEDHKESFKDGKLSQKLGNKSHEFYIDDNGRIRYNIVYEKEPDNNIIEFDLDFSDNLEFRYQKPLKDELITVETSPGVYEKFPITDFPELYNNSHQPENVVGGYAIYLTVQAWTSFFVGHLLWLENEAKNKPIPEALKKEFYRRLNKYKTRKFCHLYRMKLIDANGVERWVDNVHIDVDNKKMYVTCNFSGLDFPVTLDPEFGNSTAGASSYGSSGVKWGTTYQAPASTGAIATWHCAVAAVDGSNPGVKLGLYETTGIYAPPHSPRNQALVEQVAFDVSVSDDESTAGSGGTITSGNWYWIGPIVENSNTKIKYDSGGGADQAILVTGTSYGAEMVDPWSNSASGDTRLFSVWIDYGSAGSALLKIINESISISENNQRNLDLNRIVNETENINENNQRNITLTRIVNSTVSIASGILRNLGLTRIKNESVNISENNQRNITLNRIVNESENIQETNQRNITFVKILNESVNIVEGILRNFLLIKIVNESISIAENILKFRGFVKIINESISISENVQKKITTIITAVLSAIIKFKVDSEVRVFMIDNDVRKFKVDNEVRVFDVT